MKSNAELQNDVQNALKWEPLLHAAEIGVTTKDCIVSLTGVVDSYIKKIEAEHAAKKVIGVKALVENIEVKIANSWSKTDVEIANEVLDALNTNWSNLTDKLNVRVENGWVTLDGELPWDYQREAAKNAVKYLKGVKNVINNIKVKPDSLNAIEKNEVENAMKRSSIDDSGITIEVSGATVTISGVVTTWYQKEEAERVAWNTPGIWHVNNELTVDYYNELVS